MTGDSLGARTLRPTPAALARLTATALFLPVCRRRCLLASHVSSHVTAEP